MTTQTNGTTTPSSPPQHPSRSADGQYYVLPTAVLRSLPEHVQHQVAAALQQIHQHDQHSWPIYQVVPCRWARLGDLDETQLRQHGVVAELDPAGEMTYRSLSTGNQLATRDLHRPVLTPVTD